MSDTPKLTPMPPEDIIRGELQKIASLITGARRLMIEGRSVDLTAVEDRIRIITESITAATPEVSALFKEHLCALIEVLDSLQADLESQHDVLEDQKLNLKRREALDAYGAPSTPPPPDPSSSDET